MPDAFLNGLNAAERDEFTKLFISRIYGENKRLPVYTVGGDNSEFFAKIFVFMGRYRNVNFGRTARKDLRVQQSHPLKKMQPPLFRTEERRFFFCARPKIFHTLRSGGAGHAPPAPHFPQDGRRQKSCGAPPLPHRHVLPKISEKRENTRKNDLTRSPAFCYNHLAL